MKLEEKLVALVRLYLDDKEDEFTSKWEEWFSGDTSGRGCFRRLKYEGVKTTERTLMTIGCWLKVRNCYRQDWSKANYCLALAIGRALSYYWQRRSWVTYEGEAEMGHRKIYNEVGRTP